jgi:transcription termination factor Rho
MQQNVSEATAADAEHEADSNTPNSTPNSGAEKGATAAADVGDAVAQPASPGPADGADGGDSGDSGEAAPAGAEAEAEGAEGNRGGRRSSGRGAGRRNGNARRKNTDDASGSAPMNLTDLKTKSTQELIDIAGSIGLENMARSRKQDIIFSILKRHAKSGEDIYGDGVLEILQDGFGFLRSADSSYLAGPDDIYVSPSQIRRFNLRTGDTITGKIRPPKDGALLRPAQDRRGQLLEARVLQEQDPVREPDAAVSGRAPDPRKGQRQHGRPDRAHHRSRRADRQGAARPARRTAEGRQDHHDAEHRPGDLSNNPECYMIVLLIDERPGGSDGNAALRGRVCGAEVVASTFDEPPARHVQVADMVIEKAKRLVEHKRDVVILLDSITRLARAFNTVVPAARARSSPAASTRTRWSARSASSAPRATSRKAAACRSSPRR